MEQDHRLAIGSYDPPLEHQRFGSFDGQTCVLSDLIVEQPASFTRAHSQTNLQLGAGTWLVSLTLGAPVVRDGRRNRSERFLSSGTIQSHSSPTSLLASHYHQFFLDWSSFPRIEDPHSHRSEERRVGKEC